MLYLIPKLKIRNPIGKKKKGIKYILCSFYISYILNIFISILGRMAGLLILVIGINVKPLNLKIKK